MNDNNLNNDNDKEINKITIMTIGSFFIIIHDITHIKEILIIIIIISVQRSFIVIIIHARILRWSSCNQLKLFNVIIVITSVVIVIAAVAVILGNVIIIVAIIILASFLCLV